MASSPTLARQPSKLCSAPGPVHSGVLWAGSPRRAPVGTVHAGVVTAGELGSPHCGCLRSRVQTWARVCVALAGTLPHSPPRASVSQPQGVRTSPGNAPRPAECYWASASLPVSSEPCCRGLGVWPWSWRGHAHHNPFAQDVDCVSQASACSHTQPPPARPCGPQAGSRPTESAGGHTRPGGRSHPGNAGGPSSLRGPPPGSWALRGLCHLLLLPSPPARTCLRHRHLPRLPHCCSQRSDQQQLHLCLTSTEGSTGQRSAASPLVPTATSTVTSIHVSTPHMASVSTPDQQHHHLHGLMRVTTDSVSIPSMARTLQL